MKSWNLIQQLQESDQMSDDELEEILEEAGVENINKINIDDFENIVDVLSEGLEEEEEGDEDGK